MKGKYGFTFVEIILVIAILGILATFISGNFITSLKKSRDARRKMDIQNIQKAFEMYYEDVHQYPPEDILSKEKIEHPTIPNKIYMQKIPKDPIANYKYFYETDDKRTYYKLYSCIENTNDSGNGVNQNGWIEENKCGCGNSMCKFMVASENAP